MSDTFYLIFSIVIFLSAVMFVGVWILDIGMPRFIKRLIERRRENKKWSDELNNPKKVLTAFSNVAMQTGVSMMEAQQSFTALSHALETNPQMVIGNIHDDHMTIDHNSGRVGIGTPKEMSAAEHEALKNDYDVSKSYIANLMESYSRINRKRIQKGLEPLESEELKRKGIATPIYTNTDLDKMEDEYKEWYAQQQAKPKPSRIMPKRSRDDVYRETEELRNKKEYEKKKEEEEKPQPRDLEIDF